LGSPPTIGASGFSVRQRSESLRRMGIPDDAWMAVTLSSYSPALREGHLRPRSQA
jgi:hypothetical protein